MLVLSPFLKSSFTIEILVQYAYVLCYMNFINTYYGPKCLEKLQYAFTFNETLTF